MAKAKLKTQKTEASVEDFLNSFKDDGQRADSIEIVKMMQAATGDKPKMWGTAIIGFGKTLITYESGRELDWFTIGFSPRKGKMSLYGLRTAADKTGLLDKLGKHKTGEGCIYINKLADVDTTVLKKIIGEGAKGKTAHSEKYKKTFTKAK